MRIRNLERPVDDRAPGGRLVLRQQYSHFSARFRSVLLAGAGGLLVSPFALMLGHEPSRRELAAMIDVAPIASVELGLAACLGIIALAVGLRQLAQPLTSRRVVEIDPGSATVFVDEWVGGRFRQWQEPLGAFRGVRHKVMTTSEGAFHSLVLEHRDAARHVQLAYDRHLSDQVIAELSERLNSPVLRGSKRQSTVHGMAIGFAGMLARVGRRWLQWRSSSSDERRIANA